MAIQGYEKGSMTWQAAAQRRHSHRRRANALLGVASIDLSGPREATPMIGARNGQKPGHYFCALTIAPDPNVGAVDREDQTQDPTEAGEQEEVEPVEPPVDPLPKTPLVYAEVVSTKGDATEAVKRLLAQVRDDHASLPQGVVFRAHSDRGQEFLSADLEAHCARLGIRRTTTAGYDPSANGAGESAIGYLKRHARYRMSGAMLPSSWWGVAVLAAASYSRCAAGLNEWPTVGFGTRVMCVKDPAPRNAFLPRSMPGTAFGPSTRVPGGLVVFQDGKLQELTIFQPSALTTEELRFAKLHLKNWDTPVAPAAPPTTEDWDARRAPQPQEDDQAVFSGNQLLPAAVVEEPPTEAPLREERPEDPRIRTEELVPPEPEDLPPPEPADPEGTAFDRYFEPFDPDQYQDSFVAAAAKMNPAGSRRTRVPRSPASGPGDLIPSGAPDHASTSTSSCAIAKAASMPHVVCSVASDLATQGSLEWSSEASTATGTEATDGDDNDDDEWDGDDDFQGGNDCLVESGAGSEGSSKSAEAEPEGTQEGGSETEAPEQQQEREPPAEPEEEEEERHIEDEDLVPQPWSKRRRTRKPRSVRDNRARRELKARARERKTGAALAASAVQRIDADIIEDASVIGLTVEPGARTVPDREVRSREAAVRERWRVAAEAELLGSFHRLGAVTETTPEELARAGGKYGVLPMKSVWTIKPGDVYKCRGVACGNFAAQQPHEQVWTAQAEVSSILSALRLAQMKGLVHQHYGRQERVHDR